MTCHDEGCAIHHHKHEEGCCSESKCGCCGCNCHQEAPFSDQLLSLADEAWMCLLKEKIKQKIQESSGQQMDQLAGLVSAANHKRWNDKMGACKAKDDFKEQLANFFHK